MGKENFIVEIVVIAFLMPLYDIIAKFINSKAISKGIIMCLAIWLHAIAYCECIIRLPFGTKFLQEFFFFGRLTIFCALRELIFATRTDWFF